MPAKNFGMRLAPHERRQIEQLAHAQGTNMKDAIMEAVRQRLEVLRHESDEEELWKPTGLLKDAEHLIGSFSGPEDLSTNPRYMEGYGE